MTFLRQITYSSGEISAKKIVNYLRLTLSCNAYSINKLAFFKLK